MHANFNTNQTSFILNFDFNIDKFHIARLISSFVDSIPTELLITSTATTGRPAFYPGMLLKMILFAYSRKVYSGRGIELLNQENIPMKWLTQDTPVSYKTINNFRANKQTSNMIKLSFVYFTRFLIDNKMISDEALFIDGTKVEADANKYTFTWKKSVDRYQPILKDKVFKMYEDLIELEVVNAMEKEYVSTSEGLKELLSETEDEIDRLNTAIENEPKVQKNGSSNKRKRRLLKSFSNKMKKDYLPRTTKYEKYQEIFNGRNSFSKTDYDATFMRMKEDPMMNGQLKPGYNLQIATNNQFVLHYDIFSNPTDTRTLIPFLSSMHFLDEFQNIVADAGYGSESNYIFIIDELEKDPLIPYGMMKKEAKRSYKNDKTKRQNWKYDELDDYYIDHNGVRFDFSNYSTRHDKYNFERNFKIYKASPFQLTYELIERSKTPKGNQRMIQVNPNWEYFKNFVKENLNSQPGKDIYARRKIEVEPVFGRMKAVFGVRRVHLRGKQCVENDIGILLMSLNLTKLAKLMANTLGKSKGFTFKIYKIQKSRSEFSKFTSAFVIKTSYFPASFLFDDFEVTGFIRFNILVLFKITSNQVTHSNGIIFNHFVFIVHRIMTTTNGPISI